MNPLDTQNYTFCIKDDKDHERDNKDITDTGFSETKMHPFKPPRKGIMTLGSKPQKVR